MKTVILIRHARRKVLDPREDNGLSEEGRKQATELAERFRQGELPKGSHFWASPKLRCQQTLEPTAGMEQSTLTVVKDLDEQRPEESSEEFRQRLLKIIERLGAHDGTIVACTHGDVIPELVALMDAGSVSPSYAQAFVLQFSDNRWTLQ